jgi:hypothetical protein
MVPAAAKQGLVSSLRNFAAGLTKTGMLPVAERQAVNKAILGNTIPSAVMVTGFNMLGGVDPMTSLLAGAVDLGIGYGGMKLAGKLAPGKMGSLTHKQGDKTVTTPHFMPSAAQNVVQGISPIASSIAVMPMVQNSMQQQQLQEMDQTAAIQQQELQRLLINGVQAQNLSPGTQFQLQGLEQTIDPTALMQNMGDPYGYARGVI